MSHHVPILHLGALLLFVAGCAAAPASQERALAGDYWVLKKALREGEEISFAAGTTPFTISFGKKGESSGEVACNRWTGRYSLSHGRLYFSLLASTRARCLIDEPAVARFESRYLIRLNEGARFSLSKEELALTFPDGEVWRFQPR